MGTGTVVSVLVVDDHLATVQLVKSALEGLGMEVRTAGNGAECLLAVEKRRPDLIILDVMMPVMDGFQTLQVLQQSPEAKDIPVIMLTARADDCDIAYGWRWGVSSYLTKPFSVDHLVALVRRVLEGMAQVSREEVRQVP
jgi:DNA-binding response OmpR family regulator